MHVLYVSVGIICCVFASPMLAIAQYSGLAQYDHNVGVARSSRIWLELSHETCAVLTSNHAILPSPGSISKEEHRFYQTTILVSDTPSSDTNKYHSRSWRSFPTFILPFQHGNWWFESSAAGSSP